MGHFLGQKRCMCARCVAGCNKQREREFKRDNKNEMLRSPLQNLRNQLLKK